MELELAGRNVVGSSPLPLPEEFTLGGILFRCIPGTQAKLAASRCGKVVGMRGRLLKPRKQSSGYLWFCYKDDRGAYRNVYAHRAVAMCWIPNIHKKQYVNHKDGNKQNNDIDNLEWVTPQENHIHAISKGLVTNLPEKGEMGFRKLKHGAELKSVTIELIKEQGGLCPICGLRLLIDSAVADHDHDTGLVRGALHRGCNGFLGKANMLAKRWAKACGPEEKVAETLLNAAYYLMQEQYPLYYPTHKTEVEKRAARNSLARKRYAASKTTSS